MSLIDEEILTKREMISEILDKVSGSGSTVGYLQNKAAASLVVGSGSTDYTIHQTRMYHHYMPGKSQFALSSFNFNEVRENTVKRTGYFDDNDGIYFEQAPNGTLSF